MITRAERRKRNWKKAIRKRRIAKEIYPSIAKNIMIIYISILKIKSIVLVDFALQKPGIRVNQEEKFLVIMPLIIILL